MWRHYYNSKLDSMRVVGCNVSFLIRRHPFHFSLQGIIFKNNSLIGVFYSNISLILISDNLYSHFIKSISILNATLNDGQREYLKVLLSKFCLFVLYIFIYFKKYCCFCQIKSIIRVDKFKCVIDIFLTF